LSYKLLFLITAFLGCFSAYSKEDPYLYILGIAQDAGYPQAGCYKKHCLPGWQDPGLERGATSIAVIDPATSKKYLFEATPHFPRQLYELSKEAPDKQYQLDGIFLTHAHIGHYAGLMFLGHEAMGASGVSVYAMPRMTDYLKNNGPWSQLVSFNNIQLNPLEDHKTVQLDKITIKPFLVPHRDEYSETVGFNIKGPNKTAIFIPDINKWSQWKTSIVDLVQSVDYALIDATFFADGELPGRDMSKVKHPFVVDSMKLFEKLPINVRNKVWFIHINHTNPLLNENSEESTRVINAGFNIAREGIRLSL